MRAPDGLVHRLAIVCAGLALALAAASAGAAEGPQLRHATTASGGGVAESGPFRLYSTIGEPVAGPVSQSGFRLVGGLQATFTRQQQGLDGPIFRDGFESLIPLRTVSSKRSGS